MARAGSEDEGAVTAISRRKPSKRCWPAIARCRAPTTRWSTPRASRVRTGRRCSPLWPRWASTRWRGASRRSTGTSTAPACSTGSMTIRTAASGPGRSRTCRSSSAPRNGAASPRGWCSAPDAGRRARRSLWRGRTGALRRLARSGDRRQPGIPAPAGRRRSAWRQLPQALCRRSRPRAGRALVGAVRPHAIAVRAPAMRWRTASRSPAPCRTSPVR